MAILVDHANINVNNTTRSFGPVAVPDNLATFTIRLARCTAATPTIWPDPAVKVSINVFISRDNGATWSQVTGFTSEGGISSKEGVDQPESYVTSFDQPSPGRLARADMIVTGGRLQSELTVEVN